MNNIPSFVAFQVTGRCNWDCIYCFSKKEIKEMDTEKCKKVIKKIADAGVEIISLAGREPFLRNDIIELVDYIKSCNCKAVIETNGSLVTREILLKCKADWLSFSVDSIDKELCKKIRRGYLSKERVCRLIKTSKELKIKTKVNTVVSRFNINKIRDIGEMLSSCPPTVWKLRQFTAREEATRFENELRVSLKELYMLAGMLCEKFPKLIIETKTSFEQSKTCFMIWPNGKVVVPRGYTHKIIGDIFENEVVNLWTRLNFNQKVHKNNVERTYR